MNIRETLLEGHSLALSQRIARYIGHDPARFRVLMSLFLEGEPPLPQRAGSALAHTCEAHPELILPYTTALIANLQQPGHHDAVIRNTLRVFEDIELPEADCGPMVDLCLKYIQSEKYPPAIRAFAMKVVCDIALRYPELKTEVQLIIRSATEAPEAAPAILARGKKMLRRLVK